MNKTVTFPPINSTFEDQFNKAFEQEPTEQATQRARKIKFTTDHIDQVTHVNGRRVFHPLVDGEDIHFFLTDCRIMLSKLDLPLPKGRTHYYPIQYAEIIFENKG
jgi:hypothetical protein